MFRAALWTLRQPRYAAMAAAMFVVAAICVGAGFFELHRYHEKQADNRRLHANAVAAATPLSPRTVPLTGRGAAPDALAIRYRSVSVTGRFLPSAQTYLGDQSQGGRQGFDVITPFATDDGVLLVARGFVPATAAGSRPATVAAPPAGTVTINGRLQTASSADGRAADGEIASVDAAAQARVLGRPVYQAYVDLTAGQPGGAGLRALPGPPRSNPTGGASEWQLLSYVVQWWTFAVLALLAPFLICRNEVREARRRFLGVEDVDFDERAAASALDPADAADSAPAATAAGALAVRSAGTLAERSGVSAERYERARRLADRYGRSLGPEHAVAPAAPRGRAPVAAPVRDSSEQPHRSEGDDYHGSYNDYLWQLALRDGDLPAGPDVEVERPAVGPGRPPSPPRVIDAEPDDSR